jgi:hypothetical protein
MARATAASVGGEPHLLSRYGCEAALAVLHCDRSSRTPPRSPQSPRCHGITSATPPSRSSVRDLSTEAERKLGELMDLPLRFGFDSFE